jgi:hypothetical protein
MLRPRLATAAVVALSAVTASAAGAIAPAAHATASAKTVRVSTAATESPSMSSNGRYVVFTSGPTYGSQVILWDRKTEATRTVAVGDAATHTHVGQPSISPDGRYIAYVIATTTVDLSGAPLSQASQVLLWDRAAGTTTPVTTLAADGDDNYRPQVSSGAHFVAYGSTDLHDDSTTYVWNRTTGARQAVSPAGYEISSPQGISDNGRYVLVAEERYSEAETSTNVLVDRTTGKSQQVGGETGALSGNGRYVVRDAYRGSGKRFHPYPVVWDRKTDKTKSLHVAPKYAKNAGVAQGYARGGYSVRDVSTTGRYVLVRINNKHTAKEELVLLDRRKGTTVLIGKRPDFAAAAVSRNGKYVAFETGDHAKRGYQYGASILKVRER